VLRFLLVTHGDLGRALLATAQGIAGAAAPAEVEVVSNAGQSLDALTAQVAACLTAWGGAEGVVLTDLFGGSTTQAAVAGARGLAGVAVVSGVSLPMVVDFLANRARYGPAEMAARLTDKGRAGVRLVLLPPGTAESAP
jgi:mannose/fructose-specific phosphotransferase system component IIA